MRLEAAAIEEQPTHGEIAFMGAHFYCDHEGVLFWPEKNCLIVSDLHLEKGAAMASRGNLIPPYDTLETLNRLNRCIERWQPKMVICLGDSFHRDDSAGNLPLPFLSHLKALMSGREWVWISGNHDRDHPAGLGGTGVDEITMGPISFRHEQQCRAYLSTGQMDLFANPPDQAAREIKGEISGHLHPVAVIRRRAKRLRRRCFISDNRRLIMPAFGTFTGGLSVRSEAFRGLFEEDGLHVWMLGRERVYKIAADQLT